MMFNLTVKFFPNFQDHVYNIIVHCKLYSLHINYDTQRSMYKLSKKLLEFINSF